MRQPKPRHVARKKPAVARKKHAVARKKHAVAQQEPAVTQQEPAVAQQEPAVAQPTAIPATQDADSDSPVRQTAQILETWRGQLLATELDVSPHFVATDSKDVRHLCRLIAEHHAQARLPKGKSASQVLRRKVAGEKVAAFLADTFRSAFPGLASKLHPAYSFSEQLRDELLAALNWVIDPGGFGVPKPERDVPPVVLWNPERFRGIRLSADTEQLLAKAQEHGRPPSARLNRYLLADAFPFALNRVPRWPSGHVTGALFPKAEELLKFTKALRALAAEAGLLGEITPAALARIDKRCKNLGLLDEIHFLVERLLMVPPDPRLQILAAARKLGKKPLDLAGKAYRHVTNSPGLDSRLTWKDSPKLSSLLVPGTSAGLQRTMAILEEFFAGTSGKQLPENVQTAMADLVEYAVAGEVRLRTQLWEQYYGDIRSFCDWLHELCLADVKRFVATILAGKEERLNELSMRHWKRFPGIDEVDGIAKARRQRQERRRKKIARATPARAQGIRRVSRNSSDGIGPDLPWYYVQ